MGRIASVLLAAAAIGAGSVVLYRFVPSPTPTPIPFTNQHESASGLVRVKNDFLLLLQMQGVASDAWPSPQPALARQEHESSHFMIAL